MVGSSGVKIHYGDKKWCNQNTISALGAAMSHRSAFRIIMDDEMRFFF
jgi:hypothetical protein